MNPTPIKISKNVSTIFVTFLTYHDPNILMFKRIWEQHVGLVNMLVVFVSVERKCFTVYKPCLVGLVVHWFTCTGHFRSLMLSWRICDVTYKRNFNILWFVSISPGICLLRNVIVSSKNFFRLYLTSIKKFHNRHFCLHVSLLVCLLSLV